MFQKCPVCKSKGVLKNNEQCPTCLGERVIHKENGLPPSRQWNVPYIPYVPATPYPYPYPPFTPWITWQNPSGISTGTISTIGTQLGSGLTTDCTAYDSKIPFHWTIN